MNKPFSVICYVIAGFFIYTIMVLAFVSEPPTEAKIAIIGVFSVPAAISLLIGLRASHYTRWQRNVGIVFISASLFTMFLALTVGCMLATPELEEQFPTHRLDFFSDYLTGSFFIFTFLGFGVWLLKRRPPRNNDETVA